MSFQAFDMGTLQGLMLMLGPGLPLALSVGLIIRSWQSAVFRLTAWSALPALLVAMLIPESTKLKLPWLFLEARLGMDATGHVILFFTALLWLLAGAYARSYMAKDRRRPEFFAFYLLTMSGNFGLILAQDLLSFYVFFALMSFSAYGLVVHNRNPEAIRAGRVYIYLVVLGELLLFTALVMVARKAGSLNLEQTARIPLDETAMVLLLLGFGIKAGALPLHVWLPLAHSEAPTPASAVLSGAMIKAGLLGWLRFLPMGMVVQPKWGILCVVAGLVAIFYGVVVGLTQRNPKTILAYSSISQMGYMTACIGLGLLIPSSWPLALSVIWIYAHHHALAKGALFLGVGVAAAVSANPRHRQLVFAGLVLSALALAGAPFTSGAVAKAALKSLVGITPYPWHGWLGIFQSLGALGTTLLMGRFLYVVWPRPPGHVPMRSGLWLSWTLLLACVTGSVWLWSPAAAIASHAFSPEKLWMAFWPVGLGAILVLGVLILIRKRGTRISLEIPAGDLLAVAEWLVGLSHRDRFGKAGATARKFIFFLSALLHRTCERFSLVSVVSLSEASLGRWTIVCTLFLVMAVVIFVLLLSSPH